MGEVRIYLSLKMDNMMSWNIRGLNTLNKQKEVRLLCSRENVGLVGLFETKIKMKNIKIVANNNFEDGNT